MNKSLAAIALVAALIASSTIAQANTLVTYDLVGVTFADNGTASGSFTVDWTTDTITALSISTTTGSDNIPAQSFSSANLEYPSGNGTILALSTYPGSAVFDVGAAAISWQVAFNYTAPDGIVLALNTTVDGVYDSLSDLSLGHFVPNDDVIAGSVAPTVTPLPGSLPLIATGLGVLGVFGWLRKRKAAAIAT